MGRVLFFAFFLGMFVLPAQSQTATGTGTGTGTWSWKGPNHSSGVLRTMQTTSAVRFQLELQRGAPTFNSGFIEGEFALVGTQGIFRGEKEYDECEIIFNFEKSKVVLETDAVKNRCGFGNGVIAQGNFFRRSKAKPTFSAGDPRLSN